MKIMKYLEGWVGAGTYHSTNTVAGRLRTQTLSANKHDITWRNKLQFLLHLSLRSSFREKFDNSRQTSTFIVQFCSYSRWIQLSSCSIWIQVQCSDLHLSSTMQWDDKQIFWKMILSFRLVAFILFYFILCPHFKIISKKEVECNSYSLSNRNNAFTFAQFYRIQLKHPKFVIQIIESILSGLQIS